MKASLNQNQDRRINIEEISKEFYLFLNTK